MNIVVVLGTAREGRQSEHVAKALHAVFSEKEGVDSTLVDVRDYLSSIATMPMWGDRGLDAGLSKWKDIAEKADGFVFVLPEYNRGYPGEWKLLVDSLTKPFHGKPAAIAGVSSGMFAGARVVEHVKTVLVELGLVAVSTAHYTGKVKEQFDDEGNMTDESARERLEKFVDAFMNDVKKYR